MKWLPIAGVKPVPKRRGSMVPIPIDGADRSIDRLLIIGCIDGSADSVVVVVVVEVAVVEDAVESDGSFEAAAAARLCKYL